VAKRLLRREHVVAASLVGAVVVVIGFASGLGSRPGTGASAAPAPGSNQEPPAATAPVTTAQTQPPQGGSPGYTGGGGGGGGGQAVPVTTLPALPPGTGHTGHPTAPPATTTPPATTLPPGMTCEPGLVPVALDTLLGTLGRATGALGLGAAPTVVGTTAALLPQLPEGTPLDQFVATCPTPATTTTPTTTGHGG
jgi:hypothetical protein